MAELYRVTTGGTPEIGGTFTCKPPNAMAGEACRAPHLSWTDAPLAANEMFFIEMGGCRHRYHAPLSRCVYVGKPTERMTQISNVIAEGLEAVLDAARPGVACEEVTAAWSKVIARHGISKDARIGYPVGIGYPPTWGELTCSMRKEPHQLALLVGVGGGPVELSGLRAHDPAVDRDVPGARVLHEVHAAQECALPRAAGADHADHLAALDLEIDALQHMVVPEILVQGPDLDNRVAHSLTSSSILSHRSIP